MGQLYDVRGNELLVGLPDQVNGGVVTDGRTATNVLSALNAEVIMDLNGAAVAYFDVRSAAAVLTYLFEATLDGVNYFAVPAFAVNQALAATLTAEQYISSVTIATTHTGQYAVGVTGFRRVRLRVSAFTSGSITVAVRATGSDLIIYARPIPATLHVTATAAVNTGATATLPAAGTGLFHYITRVELVKLYSVVGVAAGAGVIITTTNLPGGPSFTTEQLASPAGTVARVITCDFQQPLKSAVANTATTFVAGAQLQTIWRWNVSYYVGS
jgi:hypothetical protein